MNPSLSQPVLCALLRYFHHGNLTSLRKAVELCVPDAEAHESYYYYNLVAALNISGLVEITETDQKQQWCVGFDSDVRTNGSVPKFIPTTTCGLEMSDGNTRPLISTRSGSILLQGSEETAFQDEKTPGIFGKSFSSYLPRFKDVEAKICQEEEWHARPAAGLQQYDPISFTWVNVSEEPDAPCFVRARHEFGGIRYHVLHPKHRLQFRLFSHDWASYAAFNILGWERYCPFSIDRRDLRIQRTFRIPTILLRFLFASSESLRIGPHLEFFGVQKFALDIFSDFFSLVEKQ